MDIGIIGRSEYTYESMLLLKKKVDIILASSLLQENLKNINIQVMILKNLQRDNNIPFLHDPKIDLTKD